MSRKFVHFLTGQGNVEKLKDHFLSVSEDQDGDDQTVVVGDNRLTKEELQLTRDAGYRYTGTTMVALLAD